MTVGSLMPHKTSTSCVVKNAGGKDTIVPQTSELRAFFISFLCFFSSLSPLDIFDILSHLLRYFQIRFVYRDSDVYHTSRLSLSRCVSSITIFYRVPNMFRLLQSSFAIQLCFVNHNEDTYMFSLSQFSFSIYIGFVCRALLLSSGLI